MLLVEEAANLFSVIAVDLLYDILCWEAHDNDAIRDVSQVEIKFTIFQTLSLT